MMKNKTKTAFCTHCKVMVFVSDYGLCAICGSSNFKDKSIKKTVMSELMDEIKDKKKRITEFILVSAYNIQKTSGIDMTLQFFKSIVFSLPLLMASLIIMSIVAYGVLRGVLVPISIVRVYYVWVMVAIFVSISTTIILKLFSIIIIEYRRYKMHQWIDDIFEKKPPVPWLHEMPACAYYDWDNWCTLDQPELMCPCSCYRDRWEPKEG